MLSSSSQRFAASLLQLAQDQGQLDAVRGDMDRLAGMIAAEPALARALASPVISSEKKLSILQALMQGATEMTANFIVIISRRNREALLAEIANSFISQHEALQGRSQGTVTTATPLDGEQRTHIAALAKKAAGMDVTLTEKVDTALIGGFVLRIGDKQIDQSVASRIASIRKELVTN